MSVTNPIERELQKYFVPPLANIIYRYAESEEARIVRIRNAILSVNAHSNPSPEFEIVAGTHSFAESERESIGVELPYNAMKKRGFTVRCTHFGGAQAMTSFFQYLAKDSEITSFMPCEVGAGYLKGVDQAIAVCIRQNTTLEALDVHNCSIGEEGVLSIVDALEANTSLKYLNIRANGISNRILARLIEVLRTHNRTLLRFSFTQNNWSDERALDPHLIQEAGILLQANSESEQDDHKQ